MFLSERQQRTPLGRSGQLASFGRLTRGPGGPVLIALASLSAGLTLGARTARADTLITAPCVAIQRSSVTCGDVKIVHVHGATKKQMEQLVAEAAKRGMTLEALQKVVEEHREELAQLFQEMQTLEDRLTLSQQDQNADLQRLGDALLGRIIASEQETKELRAEVEGLGAAVEARGNLLNAYELHGFGLILRGGLATSSGGNGNDARPIQFGGQGGVGGRFSLVGHLRLVLGAEATLFWATTADGVGLFADSGEGVLLAKGSQKVDGWQARGLVGFAWEPSWYLAGVRSGVQYAKTTWTRKDDGDSTFLETWEVPVQLLLAARVWNGLALEAHLGVSVSPNHRPMHYVLNTDSFEVTPGAAQWGARFQGAIGGSYAFSFL